MIDKLRVWLMREPRQLARPSNPGVIVRLGLLGGIATLAAIGLVSVHPEPAAQSAGISVIHPWSRGEARVRQSLPVYVVSNNDGPCQRTSTYFATMG